MLVVTSNDVPGYRVVRVLGVARGLSVRSRSVVGNIGASIQILFGGNITLYTKLAEQARQEAFDLLVGGTARLLHGADATRDEITRVLALLPRILPFYNDASLLVGKTAGYSSPSSPPILSGRVPSTPWRNPAKMSGSSSARTV